MRLLVSAEEIQLRITELAREINRDYADKSPILIGVLKGSFMFLAHLVGQLDCDPEIDFIEASSYGADKSSSGTIRIHKDLSREIRGRHVIVIEDVLDTGLTLDFLVQSLALRQPESMEVCTLVEKEIERSRDLVHPKYVGFKLPNEFIIGFGMDYAEKYRELPYIGVLEES